MIHGITCVYRFLLGGFVEISYPQTSIRSANSPYYGRFVSVDLNIQGGWKIYLIEL